MKVDNRQCWQIRNCMNEYEKKNETSLAKQQNSIIYCFECELQMWICAASAATECTWRLHTTERYVTG